MCNSTVARTLLIFSGPSSNKWTNHWTMEDCSTLYHYGQVDESLRRIRLKVYYKWLQSSGFECIRFMCQQCSQAVNSSSDWKYRKLMCYLVYSSFSKATASFLTWRGCGLEACSTYQFWTMSRGKIDHPDTEWRTCRALYITLYTADAYSQCTSQFIIARP